MPPLCCSFKPLIATRKSWLVRRAFAILPVVALPPRAVALQCTPPVQFLSTCLGRQSRDQQHATEQRAASHAPSPLLHALHSGEDRLFLEPGLFVRLQDHSEKQACDVAKKQSQGSSAATTWRGTPSGRARAWWCRARGALRMALRTEAPTVLCREQPGRFMPSSASVPCPWARISLARASRAVRLRASRRSAAEERGGVPGAGCR